MSESEPSPEPAPPSRQDPNPDGAAEAVGDETNDIVPARGYETTPMVGLGGSAGSVQALQAFFAVLPPKTGMVFVVILHLSPDYESNLAALIQDWTPLKVATAADQMKVERDCVYVIPPGKQLTAADGHLRLGSLGMERGRHVAVDLFFRSLADTHGPHAAAIVLSGLDGDGAVGIKRIKEHGGLTVAQDPDEAEHSGMPRSAIDTGMVDWILPTAEMPQRLLNYFFPAKTPRLPPEEGPQPAKPAAPPPNRDEAALREVLTFLRTRTGRDFSCYKRATIVRRISRRMQVNSVEDLPGYIEVLRTHPGEAGALLQDLLISVTNFFRDRDAFEALEREYIPTLFTNKWPADTVRVWVPACATGEEAYSIAMLLQEQADRIENPPALQVFASDLDENAIQKARAGVYPDASAADLSEERLRRFFIKQNAGYRVRRELREMVLFAAHDLLKDAPFSRMDLISCRNLLIYLNHEAQTRLHEIFHFALNPGGRLFLGSSELVEEGSPLFHVLDKKHRIYVRQPAARTGLFVPSGPSIVMRALETQERTPVSHGKNFVPTSGSGLQTAPSPAIDRLALAELHFRLLERFAPPSVVINADYGIVHLSENAGEFLHFSGGEPTNNLLRVVNPMLRIELRAALFRAAEIKGLVQTLAVPAELDGEMRRVDLRVSPANEMAPGFFLVVFELRSPSPGKSGPGNEAQSAPEPIVRQLERELESAKGLQRDTVEQYEASTEELKASNEELQAMNEELRSATEELETSREELQSINEELITVNHEMKAKVDELAHANSDLQNLMASTSIATVFLDRDLAVTRYTPGAVELFHFIPADVARPLAHLKHTLDYPDLFAECEGVLRTLVPVEREVRGSGRWFLGRLQPYRSLEDRIGGVVLTFVDITARKLAEGGVAEANDALRASETRLRQLIESARDYAIFATDLERRVTSWNTGAQRLLGFADSEILGQPIDLIFTEEDRAAGAPAQEVANAIAHGRSSDQRWHQRKDGTRFWADGALMLMRDSADKPAGFVKIFRDQTEAREARKALEESRAELWEALQETEKAREQVETEGRRKDRFLAVLSHELRTPLAPAVMAVSALEENQNLPTDVREELAMVRRNLEIETKLIDDLLDLNRIGTGKLGLETSPVEVSTLVQEVCAMCQSEATAHSLQVGFHTDPSVGTISADPVRLRQALWNLLRNAIKFTPDGGRITCSANRLNTNRIELRVQDTGIGIRSEVMSQIFEAFEQGDAGITRRFGGLGLGLAIAKALVALHGGVIRVESDGLGRGATFTIELPTDLANPAAEASKRP